MAIRMLNANDFTCIRMLSIHYDGRFTFNWAAIEALSLNRNPYNRWVGLAEGEDFAKDLTFNMYVYSGYNDNAFKINWSGTYCYLSTRRLFKRLGIHYKDRHVYYSITILERTEDLIKCKLTYHFKDRKRYGKD